MFQVFNLKKRIRRDFFPVWQKLYSAWFCSDKAQNEIAVNAGRHVHLN